MTDIIFILAGILVPIFFLVVAAVLEYQDQERRREKDERKASFLFDSYLKSIGCEPIEPDYIYGL